MHAPSIVRVGAAAAVLSLTAIPGQPTRQTSQAPQPATSPIKTAPSSNPTRSTLRAKGPVGSPCIPVPSSPANTRWK